jgi:hypothetical protein
MMVATQASTQTSVTPYNWPSLFQLVLSAIAALLLIGLAAIITVTTGVQYLSQGSGNQELTQSFMVAASLAFAGVLLLPSAWFAWKSLAFPNSESKEYHERRGFGLILTLLLLVVIPGALWLGNWVSQNDQLAWLLLPLINIIVNGLSAFWVVYIGIRGLKPGPPRRVWGVFASGLVLGPSIILILELFALIGFGILAILWAAINPDISNQLQNLIFRLQNLPSNPDAILQILLPFLLNPGILFIAFALISVIVPIIEEALKPIGVWFLAGQRINPAQGFAFGVLCGAGFGLFENLGNTSAGGETWAILASTRITTLLLHCLTTGLVGWALASAWTEKRYLRLGITYAFAVIVHGLWNGLAVISALSSLEGQVDVTLPGNNLLLGNLATIGIITLGVFNLIFYISFNAFLRNSDYIKGIQPIGHSTGLDNIVNGSISIETGEMNLPTISSNSPPLSPSSSPRSSDTQEIPDLDNPPRNPESYL